MGLAGISLGLIILTIMLNMRRFLPKTSVDAEYISDVVESIYVEERVIKRDDESRIYTFARILGIFGACVMGIGALNVVINFSKYLKL